MFGKLLNALVEKAIDKWLASESSKRYLTSLVFRIGQAVMGYLLLRWASKYGIDGTKQALIQGHWTALLELAAPAVAAAAIESASVLSAKLNAKALDVAIAAEADALTPADAKAVAKAALDR